MYLVSCVEEFYNCVAADEACTARDKYMSDMTYKIEGSIYTVLVFHKRAILGVLRC